MSRPAGQKKAACVQQRKEMYDGIERRERARVCIYVATRIYTYVSSTYKAFRLYL